jgi:hypothetical protein
VKKFAPDDCVLLKQVLSGLLKSEGQSFDGLMAANTKEIEAATAAIETKPTHLGEVIVQNAEMKNDLGGTVDSRADDKKFLADLEKNCGGAQEKYDGVVKLRAEELAALADVIKMLNDDGAIVPFKMTLPSAASLLQGQAGTTAATRKQEYYAAEFDSSNDMKKAPERSVSDATAAIKDAEESLATLTTEIKASMDGNSVAKEQIEIAKNRRKKYKKKCVKPPGDARGEVCASPAVFSASDYESLVAGFGQPLAKLSHSQACDEGDLFKLALFEIGVE